MNASTARLQIAAGEVGTIDVGRLKNGRFRERASNRDDSGALHRIAVRGDTQDETIAEVHRPAGVMAIGGVGALSTSRTIAEAVSLASVSSPPTPAK